MLVLNDIHKLTYFVWCYAILNVRTVSDIVSLCVSIETSARADVCVCCCIFARKRTSGALSMAVGSGTPLLISLPLPLLPPSLLINKTEVPRENALGSGDDAAAPAGSGHRALTSTPNLGPQEFTRHKLRSTVKNSLS